MEKERLKLIVRNLELLVDSLKAEIYSDTDAYIDKRENYDDPPESKYGDYDEIYNDDELIGAGVPHIPVAVHQQNIRIPDVTR